MCLFCFCNWVLRIGVMDSTNTCICFCSFKIHLRVYMPSYLWQIMKKSCACEFLYGDETSEIDRHSIMDALKNEQIFKDEVSFHRKNGNKLNTAILLQTS